VEVGELFGEVDMFDITPAVLQCGKVKSGKRGESVVMTTTKFRSPWRCRHYCNYPADWNNFKVFTHFSFKIDVSDEEATGKCTCYDGQVKEKGAPSFGYVGSFSDLGRN